MIWFRMYHEFATDPKIQMLSEADQRRFVMLLCLKACNGNVTLHETEVAFQLRITDDEWADTKARLLTKNLIQPDNTPTSWDKRQYISDSSSERVKRHREKVKRDCNVTVTPPDTDTDTDTEVKQSKIDWSSPEALRRYGMASKAKTDRRTPEQVKADVAKATTPLEAMRAMGVKIS